MAKIKGELEGAQLENVNGVPSNLPDGRIWLDTANAKVKAVVNGVTKEILTKDAARSDIAAGSANHVVINDGTGRLSSEAQLAKSRGGTGADNSSVTFPATGTIVTRDATETLTNKTLTSPVINTPNIDGGTASNTSRITVPKDTLTNLQSLTRKQGTLVFDTTSNKPYYDDGTNLKVIGSGSGGTTNLIDDGDAEAGTSNYVEGSYSAATRPSGTFTPSSGVGAFAISTTTSSPLFGNTSFLLTKSSGASRQGRAVERTIAIDAGYRTKMLKTRIDYTIVSGSFVAGSNGSSPTDSSLIWYVGQHNGSTWTYHEPSTFKMFSSSTTNPDYVEGEFQVNSDTTQIKLIAYVAETANSAWVVKCEVGFKESTYLAGTTTTSPRSYVPALTNLGSTTNVNGSWYQDGAYLHGKVTFTAGVGTGSVATIGLPSGLAMPSTNLGEYGFRASQNNIVGKVASGTTGSGVDFVVLANPSSSTTTLTIGIRVAATLDNLTSRTGSDLSSTYFDLDFKVPISGWSSSTQVSDGYDGRLIAARYTTTGGVTSWSAGQVIKYTTLVFDKTNSYSTSTGLFTCPSAGVYRVTAQFYGTTNFTYIYLGKNGSSELSRLMQSSASGNTGSVLVDCNAGDTLGIYNASATVSSVDGAGYNSVSFEKLSSPQTMSATEVVSAMYNTTSTQSFNSTQSVANFGTKIHDTHNAVSNASSNFTFTAPVAGFYEAYSRQFSGSGQSNVDVWSDMFFNGSVVGRDYQYIQSTNALAVIRCYGYGWLNAGETIQLKTRAGSPITTSSSAVENFITIKRIK